MDFTHAFTCGSTLDRRLGYIEQIQDVSIFGRFPEFNVHLSRDRVNECAARLQAFDLDIAESFVSQVPMAWQVVADTRSVWKKFLVDRAHFTAETIASRLWPVSDVLPFSGGMQ